MHSHDNLTYTARCRFRDNLSMKSFGERTVSYQPLSHIVGMLFDNNARNKYKIFIINNCVGQMTDLFVPICIGATVHFLGNSTIQTLTEKLWFIKPTYFFCVPYVWSQLKQFCEEDKNVESLKMCRNAHVLGSSVSNNLIEFFRHRNIILCKEYGTCEINFHIFSKYPRDPIESIGNVNDHKCTSIGNEGELLAIGRSVFMGYLNNESKNKECFDDQNVFHVPDRVYIDSNGSLFIFGRLTELIKTSAGISVMPTFIENEIKEELSDFIRNCMVVGD